MTAIICLLIGACVGVFVTCMAKTASRADASVAEMEIKAAQTYSALEAEASLWRKEAIELSRELKSVELRRKMAIKFARTLIDRADALESALATRRYEQEAVNG